MAEMLSSATLNLARLLGDVVDGEATGGTTATLLDSGFGKRDSTGQIPTADYYNYGCVWFLECTSTGIEGKTAIISDYSTTSSVSTFAFATQTHTVTAADTYAVTESIWPRYKLRAFTNLALKTIRAMPALDTSLTTLSNTETYTLPAGVFNVRHIQIAESTVTPYYFKDYFQGYWEEKNGLIYFKPGYWPQTTGYMIRLWYQAVHADLTSDTASISSYIDPLWLAWEGVIHAYRWRKPLNDNGTVDELVLKEAYENAGLYRRRYQEMLPKLPWKVKLANWFGADLETDEYTGTVRV